MDLSLKSNHTQLKQLSNMLCLTWQKSSFPKKRPTRNNKEVKKFYTYTNNLNFIPLLKIRQPGVSA